MTGTVFITSEQAVDILALQMALESGDIGICYGANFSGDAMDGLLGFIRELAAHVAPQIGVSSTRGAYSAIRASIQEMIEKSPSQANHEIGGI